MQLKTLALCLSLAAAAPAQAADFTMKFAFGTANDIQQQWCAETSIAECNASRPAARACASGTPGNGSGSGPSSPDGRCASGAARSATW